MKTKIYVDGRISAPEDAVVSVLDHGFLFGDSVYEVLWWHRGTLIQEREHLDRLEESGRRLYMDLQYPREALVDAMHETVAAAEAAADEDAYVRLVVTRGAGPLGLDFTQVERRSLVIVVAPANRPTPEKVERGISVACVDRRRNSVRALDPGAKTGNYLNNVLALHEARVAGADDAVMLNAAGEVTELTTANVYAVFGGAIRTPPLEAGILKGTTRTRILGICEAAGIDATEETLRPADLARADEIFVSSSVKGILPIVQVDGAVVGEGRMGPVTRGIRERFEAAADAEAAAGAAS